MKLYYPFVDNKCTAHIVQEDFDKLEDWLKTHTDYILQEEVLYDRGRANNEQVKRVDGVVVIDEEAIAEKAKEELRKQYKTERDEALYLATVEVDGLVFQTRPSDFANFEVGISKGSTKWVMADNSVGIVTTSQLEQVFNLGTEHAKDIFDAYIMKLESL